VAIDVDDISAVLLGARRDQEVGDRDPVMAVVEQDARVDESPGPRDAAS
jgi:hypothetical protein